jgi:hypothetical protein
MSVPAQEQPVLPGIILQAFANLVVRCLSESVWADGLKQVAEIVMRRAVKREHPGKDLDAGG